MSSVQYTDKCEICKGVREEYYDYMDLDFHSVCYSCGLSRSEVTKEGKLITEEQGGFGTCMLMFQDRTCSLMVMPEPMDEGAIERFHEALKFDPTIIPSGSRLTKFQDGKLISLYGELPISYEQYKNDLFGSQPFQ